jgi:hypothetical protein
MCQSTLCCCGATLSAKGQHPNATLHSSKSRGHCTTSGLVEMRKEKRRTVKQARTLCHFLCTVLRRCVRSIPFLSVLAEVHFWFNTRIFWKRLWRMPQAPTSDERDPHTDSTHKIANYDTHFNVFLKAWGRDSLRAVREVQPSYKQKTQQHQQQHTTGASG